MGEGFLLGLGSGSSEGDGLAEGDSLSDGEGLGDGDSDGDGSAVGDVVAVSLGSGVGNAAGSGHSAAAPIPPSTSTSVTVVAAITVNALRDRPRMVVPTAVALALVLVIGVPIIYGSDFEPTIRYGFVLIPGVLALGLTKVLSAVITGRGHPIYNLYIGLVDVPVTLVVYLLLIPPFGAMGAAVGSSASYVLTTVLCVAFFKRVTGISVREAMIPTRAEVRALGAAARRLLR